MIKKVKETTLRESERQHQLTIYINFQVFNVEIGAAPPLLAAHYRAAKFIVAERQGFEPWRLLRT